MKRPNYFSGQKVILTTYAQGLHEGQELQLSHNQMMMNMNAHTLKAMKLFIKIFSKMNLD